MISRSRKSWSRARLSSDSELYFAIGNVYQNFPWQVKLYYQEQDDMGAVDPRRILCKPVQTTCRVDVMAREQVAYNRWRKANYRILAQFSQYSTVDDEGGYAERHEMRRTPESAARTANLCPLFDGGRPT